GGRSRGLGGMVRIPALLGSSRRLVGDLLPVSAGAWAACRRTLTAGADRRDERSRALGRRGYLRSLGVARSRLRHLSRARFMRGTGGGKRRNRRRARARIRPDQAVSAAGGGSRRVSRRVCKPEVTGSIPVRSNQKPAGNGGFLVAREGVSRVTMACCGNEKETAPRGG